MILGRGKRVLLVFYLLFYTYELRNKQQLHVVMRIYVCVVKIHPSVVYLSAIDHVSRSRSRFGTSATYDCGRPFTWIETMPTCRYACQDAGNYNIAWCKRTTYLFNLYVLWNYNWSLFRKGVLVLMPSY